jgi:hypothetical protein
MPDGWRWEEEKAVIVRHLGKTANVVVYERWLLAEF